MNAPHAIAAFDLLEPEWDRIEALALCLVETRQGCEPPGELLATLADLQQTVMRVRSDLGGWSRLPVSDLSPIEMDSLAAVAAAELQPRVGWVFQNLQGGVAPYASAALLQNLLALRGGEIGRASCRERV